MFDGTYETFEMLKRPDTVKVLAIKDNEFIILDQEQPGQPSFYDLPGGRHDYDNETELDAIKRETLEETGMTFNSWKLVDVSQPFSKIESFIYIFLATDFQSQTDQKLDAGEKIEVLQFDFIELQNLFSSPKNRYLPKELFEKVNTIEEILALPEIKN
jgi:ADP-ribose pyrophosphatase